MGMPSTMNTPQRLPREASRRSVRLYRWGRRRVQDVESPIIRRTLIGLRRLEGVPEPNRQWLRLLRNLLRRDGARRRQL
jgi:hypothetical protein